jgi:hypothetical protein
MCQIQSMVEKGIGNLDNKANWIEKQINEET